MKIARLQIKCGAVISYLGRLLGVDFLRVRGLIFMMQSLDKIAKEMRMTK